MQTEKNVELSPETIKRLARVLARVINSSALADFYADPENVKAFNEWRKRKNAANAQRNERN